MTRERLVPLIVAVALFMENMDSTVIATSLPAIATDIGTDPLALKLAVTSYLLALAIFIPGSGWTADRFGARTVFRLAIAVFIIGSIGCALSDSLHSFVIARFVQGMGGAMMAPVGRLVLMRSVDKRNLVDAMTWVTMPALIGPLLGPPLGGFITTYFSWHWIFIINVPIGLAGIALATKYIENIRGETREPFDPIGMVGAVLSNIRGRRGYTAGASTITQQVARNVFLPKMFPGMTLQEAREKSLRRKMLEIWVSVIITTRASKDAILEMYLNDMALGQRGSFAISGFGEACRTYFNKDLKDIL